jgi:hypothetical protein
MARGRDLPRCSFSLLYEKIASIADNANADGIPAFSALSACICDLTGLQRR